MTCLIVGCHHPQARAADQAAWHDAAAAKRQLAVSVNVHWSQVRLRRALQRLAYSQRTSLHLDRRIDPDQLVDVSSSGLSLHKTLLHLASKTDGEIASLGPVVYLGPMGTQEAIRQTLRTIRRQVARLPSSRRRSLSTRVPWRWESLATPREIIKAITAHYEMSAEGLDVVEHDLWPAADLPKLNFAEIATLVCYGMQISLALDGDGQRVTFLPAKYPPAASRTQNVQVPPQHPAADAGASVHHVAPVTSLSSKRFTLRYKNRPALQLMRLLARQNALQLRALPQIQKRLQANIDLETKAVTFEQLMQRALGPLGLRYELVDEVLSIHADES